jgi:hypothetical protein
VSYGYKYLGKYQNPLKSTLGEKIFRLDNLVHTKVEFYRLTQDLKSWIVLAFGTTPLVL